MNTTNVSFLSLQLQSLAAGQPVCAWVMGKCLGLDDAEMDGLRRKLKLPPTDEPSGVGICATVYPAEFIFNAVQDNLLKKAPVLLKEIDIAADTQTRAQTYPDRVARYADAIRAGELARRAIILVKHPDGRLLIADGRHHFLAAKEIATEGGSTDTATIPAIIIPGGEELARSISGYFNSRHGLDYTRKEECQRAISAVRKFREALEKGELSRRKLSAIVGLSHTAINGACKELGVATKHAGPRRTAAKAKTKAATRAVKFPPAEREATILILREVEKAASAISLPAEVLAMIPAVIRLLTSSNS